MKTEPTPTHATQVILPSVRMLPSAQAATKATTMKTAVHAPWLETAFSPMEVLTMPDPEQKIQSAHGRY